MSTPTTARVVAHCLGAFSLEIDGHPVDRWRAGKARELFQYLLINRGRVLHRDRLHELLWPDADGRGSSLKVAAHGVRQTLAGHRPDGDDGAVELIHQDHGYLLRCGSVWLDAEEFEAAFDQGREASLAGDQAAATEHYRRAVELYLGDFLACEMGDWVEQQRLWARGIMLRCLAALRDDASRREDWPDLLRCCRRILDLDPYHEETYQTLMVMHGRAGELGQAKSWYDVCRQRLRGDLGVPPHPRTERILRMVLQRMPQPNNFRPRRTALRSAA
jgi:DNA-binding SARP family transcriptional activator